MPDSCTKRCSKCREVKPLSEFYRNATRPDGLNLWCRACLRESRQRHYQANRNVLLEQMRAYYEANGEAIREYSRQRSRQWYLASRARVYAAVFGHYGTKCACCGSTKSLSIDHIGGGGTVHRRELGRGGGLPFWRWLVREGFPPGYQTLCLSCNKSKGSGPCCQLHDPRTFGEMQNMRLDRDSILKVEDLDTEEVSVPEWNGSVLVRALTGEERDSYEAACMTERPAYDAKGKQVRGRTEMARNLANVRAKLVVRSVVGDDGERLFTDHDVAVLGQKSAAALDRVFEVAARLSRLSDEDVEDLAGNSAAAQPDDSISSSLSG